MFRGYPSNIILFLLEEFLITVFNNWLTILSTTKSPWAIMRSIFFPISVLFLISSLKRSPVDNWYRLNFLAINFACVPFPAPGGPNKIKFTFYLPNFVFLINCSYWDLINLVWTWVTVSIATTTTINMDVPPR